MVCLHTCLQSLCAEANLVMRGYYTAEKTCDLPPRLLSSACLTSSLPLSQPVFPAITLENVMLPCGGCCGAPLFSRTPGGERSSVHAGAAGFDPGIFQACASSKTSAQQQMLCLFSFRGRRWRIECRTPGFELTYHFGLHFALFSHHFSNLV